MEGQFSQGGLEAFFGETTCKLTTERQIEFGYIKISGKVLQVVGIECSKAQRGEAVWSLDDTEERQCGWGASWCQREKKGCVGSNRPATMELSFYFCISYTFIHKSHLEYLLKLRVAGIHNKILQCIWGGNESAFLQTPRQLNGACPLTILKKKKKKKQFY